MNMMNFIINDDDLIWDVMGWLTVSFFAFLVLATVVGITIIGIKVLKNIWNEE